MAPHGPARLLPGVDGRRPQTPRPRRGAARRDDRLRLRALCRISGARGRGAALRRTVRPQRTAAAPAALRMQRRAAAGAQDRHGMAQLLPRRAPGGRADRRAPSPDRLAGGALATVRRPAAGLCRIGQIRPLRSGYPRDAAPRGHPAGIRRIPRPGVPPRDALPHGELRRAGRKKPRPLPL